MKPHHRWDVKIVDVSLKAMQMGPPHLSNLLKMLSLYQDALPHMFIHKRKILDVNLLIVLGQGSPEVKPEMGVLGQVIYWGLLAGEACKAVRKARMWFKKRSSLTAQPHGELWSIHSRAEWVPSWARALW